MAETSQVSGIERTLKCGGIVLNAATNRDDGGWRQRELWVTQTGHRSLPIWLGRQSTNLLVRCVRCGRSTQHSARSFIAVAVPARLAGLVGRATVSSIVDTSDPRTKGERKRTHVWETPKGSPSSWHCAATCLALFAASLVTTWRVCDATLANGARRGRRVWSLDTVAAYCQLMRASKSARSSAMGSIRAQCRCGGSEVPPQVESGCATRGLPAGDRSRELFDIPHDALPVLRR
jgi:hypothetical protein